MRVLNCGSVPLEAPQAREREILTLWLEQEKKTKEEVKLSYPQNILRRPNVLLEDKLALFHFLLHLCHKPPTPLIELLLRKVRVAQIASHMCRWREIML